MAVDAGRSRVCGALFVDCGRGFTRTFVVHFLYVALLVFVKCRRLVRTGRMTAVPFSSVSEM